VSYSLAWGDEVRLFQLAARRVPASSRVHSMLAALYLERGFPVPALVEADRAVELNALNASAHQCRAYALGALGRSSEAASALRASLSAVTGKPTPP
jgi:Flp pilus assembly protein TadD